MIKEITRHAVCAVALALFSPHASGVDVFALSQLEVLSGYEDNRLEESEGGSGSPYWQVAPELSLSVLGANTETTLLLTHRRSQYSKTAFESKSDSAAFVLWRYFEGNNEASANIGGGRYEDEALPGDDNSYWQASPCVVRTLERFPLEISLRGTVRQTFYDDSVYTTDSARVDCCLDVRPGMRWHLSRKATVWAELYAERNGSDASEAEYTGFGGAVGCGFRPTARLDAGVWTETGIRSYAEQAEGRDRNDTPWRVGAWTTYRLRPWMELFASAGFESAASTIAGNEYSWWQVGGGVRFVFEHALTSR